MMNPPVAQTSISLTSASAALAAALRICPEFDAFQEAAARARTDAEVQRRISVMQELQNRLLVHWSAEDEERLEDMERELLMLAPMQAYTAAQEALSALLAAVDAVISEAAGVPFAANARRGCACGK